MKAVVMAGGEGSRLRPLTLNRPKPMVPMVDRPVMGHIVELLKRHHISDIVVTVQYMASVIQDHFGDGAAFGVEITYSLEDRPLGTAGSVKRAEDLLREPFLVISGDAVTDIDLTQVIERHRSAGALVTMTLKRVPNPLEYGVAICDDAGYVRELVEKPSWGEVFSDTVNTGIYVVDPAIFDYIDTDKPVDWAKDIFPRLLHQPQGIAGCVVDGYWTDVGTIDEYMRATRDYLTGHVNLPRIGRRLSDEVWVDGDVEIAVDARLQGPLYLGFGAKIKSGAQVIGPTVIRDYSIVDAGAIIDRSIIWRNSYVGERAELRGAVVLRQCNIKSRAVLSEGVIIGDQTMINTGAVIGNNVKIWPYKEVDESATVTSSIIWGSQGRRVLFGKQGITGLVNIDLTPEWCARIGAAIGSALPLGATVTANRDGNDAARMLKRALMSGLPSAGVNVLELHSVPLPVARYMTAAAGTSGGVHLQVSATDDRMIEIRIFDRNGLDLDTASERRIEGIFFREDYRRAYYDEIGRITEARNPTEIYAMAFVKALRQDAFVNEPTFQVVVDYNHASSSVVLPGILRRLGIRAVELNANVEAVPVTIQDTQSDTDLMRLAQVTQVLAARFGVRIEANGERVSMVDGCGRPLTPMLALAVLVDLALAAEGGGVVAVPMHAPRVFEALAARRGGAVVRTRGSLSALMQMAAKRRDLLLLGDGNGACIFPRFHPVADGMYTVIKVIELLLDQQTQLADAVDSIPAFYTTHHRVACGWEFKGRVMRQLGERFHERRQQTTDGLRIDGDEHWVLVTPDSDGPYISVFVEASSAAQVADIAHMYNQLIQEMQG